MAPSEQARYVRNFSAASQSTDFMLKETAPRLGGGLISDKAGAYDLVEKMSYLYVRVVKARELHLLHEGINPYAEIRLGNFKGTTKHFEKNHNPEWNEVFAFSREKIQASHLEVWLGSKGLSEERLAHSRFDLNEIPTRVPPDSPLAPQWYRLMDKEGKHLACELMLAIWHGTQADECFPNAIHAEEAHFIDASINTLIKGKVYPSPRLWYTRVQVLHAQDIYATNRSPHGQVFVKARVGNQLLKTKVSRSTTLNYEWNEHLVFVCAEPFEEMLEISVEEHIEFNKQKVIGICHLPLRHSHRRHVDERIQPSWYDLKRLEEIKEEKFSAKINLCVTHEGGYHVMAESSHYSSDLRPSSKELWRPPIGLLELGVLRAERLSPMRSKDNKGTCDAYCVAKYGNFKGTTKHFEKNHNPEWNEVFAFSREKIQASHLEVWLGSKGLSEERLAHSRFDLNEIPTRVPPDSPLAPQWYRLMDKEGKHLACELMLAIWHGTQADECFPNAIHAEEAHFIDASINTLIKGKVYPSPRLWYTRVQVLHAQDIYATNRSPHGQVFVKARVGNQLLKTKVSRSTTLNYEWNEHLVFVCAEPFEEMLEISVEEHIEFNKQKVIGICHLPLRHSHRRHVDERIQPSWYDLKRLEEIKEEKFSAKINLCVTHEGGYHVMAESSHYSSDLRPSSKELWRPPIGLLELGVLRAERLSPMRSKDNKGTCDAYCVAKYGDKWCRTRTIVDNLSPRFNEQYTWDVHDHSTVITICVFHNCLIEKGAKDLLIGKVRIRLSTLETERIYTHAYPLISLHHSGVKKMGELHLAIRFSSTSWSNLLYKYGTPHLPAMHYKLPINVVHQEYLQERAMEIVAHRMSRMEPPLRREVCDMRAHIWSMRRSRANFYRLITVLSGCFRIVNWIYDICMWKNPITTSLVHILYAMLVAFPNLILPTCFLYMSLVCLWKFRFRPRHPPHMNTKISFAEAIHHDELAEEFDTFPTSQSPELLRMRYDRLRSLAGRIQTIVGDFAVHGERIHALFTWRDPRATAMFLCWCLCMAIITYAAPFQLVMLCHGFYFMRHPRLRSNRMPSPLMNYFRRLPSKTDCLI